MSMPVVGEIWEDLNIPSRSPASWTHLFIAAITGNGEYLFRPVSFSAATLAVQASPHQHAAGQIGPGGDDCFIELYPAPVMAERTFHKKIGFVANGHAPRRAFTRLQGPELKAALDAISKSGSTTPYLDSLMKAVIGHATP